MNGPDRSGGCARCGGELAVSTVSWFTIDTICMVCSRWEDKIIESHRLSRDQLEAAGAIPQVPFDIEWGQPLD